MKVKIKEVLFLLILGSSSAFLLSEVGDYTLPRIEQLYQEQKLKSAILEAAGIDYDEYNLDEAFHKNIRKMKKNGFIYYLSPDDLYIFEFKGQGLWGPIEGVTALNPDLKTIENIRVVSQGETPGLGGRISEEGFLSQFKKKKISTRLFLVSRRKATKVNEVEAISGATITSQSLVNMINESVANFRKVLER